MVPNGWKKGLVSDLADTVMGYAFKSNDFVKEGIPLVRMGNLYQNQFQLDRSPIYLPDDFAIEYRKFLLQSGDLVMSMTGTMGKRDYGFAVEIPENTQDCLLNQRVLKIEPRNSDAKGFVLNVLKSEIFLSKLYSLPGGTKQANLSATQIREISVLIPPLPEQQKIANILSTWDKAISTTERLIDNSTQQKKALMQQLLMGKKRLLDDEGNRFEGEWGEVKLSEVAQITMGSSPKSESYNEVGDGLPLLQGNADIKNRKSVPRIYTSQITKECHVDDILFSVRAPVGTVAISSHHACIGRGIAAIKAKKNHSQDYLYQWFLSFETKWERYSQGSTFEAVNSNDIKSLNLSVPNFKEQQKIATVLTNADKEIELLEQQLADLQQEKKALMQVLLMGKKRVVVNEAVA